MADQAQPDDTADDDGMFIDGERITPNDLTFREQRQMRDVIRQLAPENDPDNATEADVIPALIYVWKHRTDPKYTLDDALDLKPGDLDAPVADDDAPPTRAKAKS